MSHDIAKWSQLRAWLHDAVAGKYPEVHIQQWEADLLLRTPRPTSEDFPTRVFFWGTAAYRAVPEAVPPDLHAYARWRVEQVFQTIREVQIMVLAGPIDLSPIE